MSTIGHMIHCNNIKFGGSRNPYQKILDEYRLDEYSEFSYKSKIQEEEENKWTDHMLNGSGFVNIHNGKYTGSILKITKVRKDIITVKDEALPRALTYTIYELDINTTATKSVIMIRHPAKPKTTKQYDFLGKELEVGQYVYYKKVIKTDQPPARAYPTLGQIVSLSRSGYPEIKVLKSSKKTDLDKIRIYKGKDILIITDITEMLLRL